MSDFLIQFGEFLNQGVVADALRSRERMGDLRVAHFTFGWGSAVIQETRGFGYDPFCADHRVYFAVGRARKIGLTHESEGPQGFTQRWARWAEGAKPARRYRDLTGSFILGCCGPERVVLLTDRLGFYAAFVGRDRMGRICALGTIPDLVAQAADRSGDTDLVSVGEFLVRHAPTFPHTLYRGVAELAPGTIHNFDVCDASVAHTARCLWTPQEPPRYATLKQLREQLACAIRDASQELTRGAERVAVSLSGGIDSRTVLASVPAQKRTAALTFLDFQNHEFRVAQRVAAACGVPHIAVVRDPDFYAGLPERESALLGLVRSAMHGHGLALADADAVGKFDVILGGFCSDTLLKGWFAPDSLRALIAARLGLPAFLRARLCTPRYTWADPTLPGSLWAVRPRIQREMQQRMAARLEELTVIRPQTAAEWISFYPLSRIRSASHSACNARLFASDELYLYRDIVEVARCCPLIPKLMLRLIVPVFANVCGDLARIEVTKTGLPLDMGWLETRVRLRLRKLCTPAVAAAPTADGVPWFADHSWVDFRMLQRHSAAWADVRRRAAAAPGMDILGAVLQIDPRHLLAGCAEALSCEFQAAAVQLALGLGATSIPSAAEPVLVQTSL